MNALKKLLSAVSVFVFVACGGVEQVAEVQTESSALLQSIEPSESSFPGDHEELLGMGKSMSKLACRASYADADVTAVRNYIQNNCGGISGCGSIESDTHSDVFLTNWDYCSCYAKLWANRASGSFSKVQIIYHEPSACANNNHHIHIQKKNLCGYWHYDVDEETDGDCTHEAGASAVDRYKNGSCTLINNTRIGTCNN